MINALRHKKHLSHYSLDEAVELVRESNVPMAYFTHISHQLGKHDEVNTNLPEGIKLAYDGLQLAFN